MDKLTSLKSQDIPFDHPDSCNRFEPGPDKLFVATPDEIEMYCRETIIACLVVLQATAHTHNGIDYIQVFMDPEKLENLWFIEDGSGGAITALLPSSY